VHIAVADNGDDVDCREHKGDPAEVSMQIEEPGRTGSLSEDAGGERQTPQDGRAHESPSDEPARSSHVPEQRSVHQLPPLVVIALELDVLLTDLGTVVVVVEVDDVVDG
jgi:hypothetical protein